MFKRIVAIFLIVVLLCTFFLTPVSAVVAELGMYEVAAFFASAFAGSGYVVSGSRENFSQACYKIWNENIVKPYSWAAATVGRYLRDGYIALTAKDVEFVNAAADVLISHNSELTYDNSFANYSRYAGSVDGVPCISNATCTVPYPTGYMIDDIFPWLLKDGVTRSITFLGYTFDVYWRENVLRWELFNSVTGSAFLDYGTLTIFDNYRPDAVSFGDNTPSKYIVVGADSAIKKAVSSTVPLHKSDEIAVYPPLRVIRPSDLPDPDSGKPEDKPIFFIPPSGTFDTLQQLIDAILNGNQKLTGSLSTVGTSGADLSDPVIPPAPVESLFDVIVNALKAVFVPSPVFFQNQFNDIKTDFEGKIPYMPYLNLVGSMKNIASTRPPDVTINWHGTTVAVVSWSWFERYRNTIQNWIRAVFYVLMLFYLIDSVYVLIRGHRLFQEYHAGNWGGKS